ncbi:MAG: DUF6512 family protein [Promethearchaeota archaeon]
MKLEDKKYHLIRCIAFLQLFLILHYAYDFAPVGILKNILGIFSGTQESIFQHMKIAFYAYIILFLIESSVFRNQIQDRTQYFYSNLIATIVLPWLIFIVYYSLLAFTGRLYPVVIEIVYANFAVLGVLYITTTLQQKLISLEYTKEIKIMIFFLLVCLVSQFTIFTLEIPELGFFFEPAP